MFYDDYTSGSKCYARCQGTEPVFRGASHAAARTTPRDLQNHGKITARDGVNDRQATAWNTSSDEIEQDKIEAKVHVVGRNFDDILKKLYSTPKKIKLDYGKIATKFRSKGYTVECTS